MNRFLIRQGRVIDPSTGFDKVADLLIEEGLVAEVAENIKELKAKVIEAEGLLVTPGFIDLHTHLREPGREDEETIESASRAAIAGGFTTITSMPNTEPVADNGAVIRYIKHRSMQAGLAKVECAGSITKGLEGNYLSEMSEMAAAGAVAFSDDGRCVQNAELMRRAMEYALMIGKPLILHCEDYDLANEGHMSEGSYATNLGLKGIPAAAEETIIARDLILASMTNAAIHITHLSSRNSVELVNAYRNKGVRVSCDATPHHLCFTEEMATGYDAFFKVNPPLRGTDDLEALRQGLSADLIDAIATDHAPHADHEKEEWEAAASGMIGLETAFSALFTEIADKGLVKLDKLIHKLTSGPAKVLGLQRGSIQPGWPADITLIDTASSWTPKASSFHSKSKNSPFIGRELLAKIDTVFVDGLPVFKGGCFT